jgi:hypothetical protein
MSVRVMALVWQLQLPDSQKIVLLALADSANDEGHCWPSMRSLARKCSRGERTVQGVIKQLVDAGHLTRREVPGKGCNYSVHPRKDCAPAATAPTPATVAGHPRSGCGQTIKEPSKNRKSGRDERANRPDDVSEEVWRDFNRQRKKLFTATALKGFVREAEKAGWPLEDAFAHATLRGWESFNADWVEHRSAATTGGKVMTPAEMAAMYRRIGRDDDADEIERRERQRSRSTGPPRQLGDILRAANE